MAEYLPLIPKESAVVWQLVRYLGHSLSGKNNTVNFKLCRENVLKRKRLSKVLPKIDISGETTCINNK